MAAAGQKKVSNPLDVDNSAAVVTIAVRADTRRACSEEKVSFHERTAKTLTQESPSMASVPSKDFFRFFPILFLPYRFPTSAAAASPGPQAKMLARARFLSPSQPQHTPTASMNIR